MGLRRNLATARLAGSRLGPPAASLRAARHGGCWRWYPPCSSWPSWVLKASRLTIQAMQALTSMKPVCAPIEATLLPCRPESPQLWAL